MSLEGEFCGLKLKSPSVLASGILGVTFSSLKRVFDEGAGIVTTKSIGIKKRKGHNGPVVFDYGFGLINSVGLSNPGIDEFKREFETYNPDFPLIVSIFGENIEDYGELASRLKGLSFNFLEVNISCPNVEDEFGNPFAFSAELTRKITGAVKDKSDKQVIVKLSPNTPDVLKIAEAAVDGGADAINVINTVGPGMVIDIYTGNPVISAKKGGISGPGILPITVRIVYELYDRLKVPIIGTGGIFDGKSALQVLMAGATVYGIGSSIYYRGLSVFREIDSEVKDFLEVNKIKNVKELIGLSHRLNKRRYFIFSGKIDGESAPEQIRSRYGFVVSQVSNTVDYKSSDVRWIDIEINDSSAVRPIPGQFYMMWIPGLDQKPFSVAYADDKTVSFAVAKRGKFTSELFRLEKGYPVGLLGPIGRGFDLSKDNYLLLGGGVGAAPVLYSALRLLEKSKKVTLVIGGRSITDIRWALDFVERYIKKYKKDIFDIFYTTEDGSLGSKGFITDVVDDLFRNNKFDFSLICGPEKFIVKAISILTVMGIPGEASIERMMKCGIGICGSCSIDPSGKRVCVDGPVFTFEELRGSNEFGRYKRDESGSHLEV